MSTGVLLFDGDCGFCAETARRLSARWDGSARAVAWQEAPELVRRASLTPGDLRRAAYWVDERGRVFRGRTAIARALLAGSGPGRLAGMLLLVPPVSWLGGGLYALVSSNRHRLPGATGACRL